MTPTPQQDRAVLARTPGRAGVAVRVFADMTGDRAGAAQMLRQDATTKTIILGLVKPRRP